MKKEKVNLGRKGKFLLKVNFRLDKKINLFLFPMTIALSLIIFKSIDEHVKCLICNASPEMYVKQAAMLGAHI